jgi:hypothetical protein
MAYFENHDSPRATQIWRLRYAAELAADPKSRRAWAERTAGAGVQAEAALWMALLKNLQASLIDATAGMAATAGAAAEPDERPSAAGGSQLAWALEWGTDWGEETRTDFENDSLLHPQMRQDEPRCRLVAAYRHLAGHLPDWEPVQRGRVYYHRNEHPGGDPDDRVLAYTRHDDVAAVVAVHNLDAHRTRTVTLDCGDLTTSVTLPQPLYDSYEAFGLSAEAPPNPQGTSLGIDVAPLQTRLFRWRILP